MLEHPYEYCLNLCLNLLAVEFKASKQENEVAFVCAIESPRLQKDAFVSKLFAKQLNWTRNIFLR